MRTQGNLWNELNCWFSANSVATTAACVPGEFEEIAGIRMAEFIGVEI